MTQALKQLEQLRKHGGGHFKFTPENYSAFGGVDMIPGPTDVAHTVVSQTFNNPTLLPRQKAYRLEPRDAGNAITEFNVTDLEIKPLVKSVASLAINEYGHQRVDYLDIAEIVETPERAEVMARRIGVFASMKHANSVNFVVVEAGFDLDEAETARASEVHNVLMDLSPDNFRIAILNSTPSNG